MDPNCKQVQSFSYLTKQVSNRNQPEEIGKDTTNSLKKKICQEDISILIIYASNTRACKFIKGILLEPKIAFDLHK